MHNTTYCMPYVNISDGTPNSVIADKYEASRDTNSGNQVMSRPAIKYSFVFVCFPPQAKYIPIILDIINVAANTR